MGRLLGVSSALDSHMDGRMTTGYPAGATLPHHTGTLPTGQAQILDINPLSPRAHDSSKANSNNSENHSELTLLMLRLLSSKAQGL